MKKVSLSNVCIGFLLFAIGVTVGYFLSPHQFQNGAITTSHPIEQEF